MPFLDEQQFHYLLKLRFTAYTNYRKRSETFGLRERLSETIYPKPILTLMSRSTGTFRNIRSASACNTLEGTVLFNALEHSYPYITSPMFYMPFTATSFTFFNTFRFASSRPKPPLSGSQCTQLHILSCVCSPFFVECRFHDILPRLFCTRSLYDVALFNLFQTAKY